MITGFVRIIFARFIKARFWTLEAVAKVINVASLRVKIFMSNDE